MSRANRNCALAAVVLASLAAVSGCGDSDADPQTTATTTSAEKPAGDRAELTPERRRFEGAILEALAEAPGGDRVDAECAVERLRESLPNTVVDEAVEAIQRGEELPATATDAAYEAGRRCAR